MSKNRLEAFSDGVIAIIITIMVLELKIPHGDDLAALVPLLPTFLSYVLSFMYVGIYWNNHHHMMHMTPKVNGRILWANLHLLFWLSTIPFATGWMGENHFATIPVAVYGVALLLSGVAYTILQSTIIKKQGPNSPLKAAVGDDRQGKISVIAYILAIPAAFVSPWISGALFIFVALLWIIPDQRIERAVYAEYMRSQHPDSSPAAAPQNGVMRTGSQPVRSQRAARRKR